MKGYCTETIFRRALKFHCFSFIGDVRPEAISFGPPATLCTHGFTITDNHGFVRTFQFVDAGTLQTTYGYIVCTDDIIFSVYFIEMMPFSHGITFRDDYFFTAFHIAAEVRFELNQMYFVVTMYCIYLVVVIKQYAQVVNSATHILVCPGAGGIFGRENL